MKRSVLILLSLCTLLGCSSELERAKSVAEKGLTELGNGKYAGSYYGRTYINTEILKIFDSPYFSRYGIDDSEATDFIATGVVSNERKEARSFFSTDILFNDIVFVDSYMYKRDLYCTDFFSRRISRYIEDGRLEREKEFQDIWITQHKDEPGFYQVGYDYCYIKYKDTPIYQLKYKLDNKYMATVYVACVKGEKPTITSVFIH